MLAARGHVDVAACHARVADDALACADAAPVAVAVAALDVRGGDRHQADCAPGGLGGRIVYHIRRCRLALLVRRLERQRCHSYE